MNDETTDRGNTDVNDEMMAVCAGGLSERSTVSQMTGLVCGATRAKGESRDGVAEFAQWTNEDAGTRAEGRAARYVATVRPAKAVTRHDQRKRRAGAWRKRRAGYGEYDDDRSECTSNGECANGIDNADTTSDGSTDGKAIMVVAATETKTALKPNVTTDATDNATDGMVGWPAPSTVATVTVGEKDTHHESTEAPSDESTA
ncbi:uncharacterized protein IUM83_15253 [Phytophthora cinnamomi]|uniref:uncharacterized protein n=1 Tax=Phytophthora cinnamomi TaxID=4785 RepID=UPI003559D728|nr:hypothetical protein IUM83_15253 [Phytophthora cinnamomi]